MLSKNYNTNQISTALTSLIEQLEKISIPTSELLTVSQISALGTLSNSITEMVKSYNPSIKEIITASEAYSQLISSFSQLGREANLEIAKSLSSIDFSSIAKSIFEIQVCKDYVNMPEAFIPDDFLYEEFLDNSENITEQDAEKSSTTKRLSLSDALTVIVATMTLLMWILAPFYNHAVERVLSKEEDTKIGSPMTEEQAQRIIEYLSELTNCQQSILTALEVSEGSIPEHDSCCCDTPPRSVIPGSAYAEPDKLPPTSVDESDSSE